MDQGVRRWPLTPLSTQRHSRFLKSTSHMEPSDRRIKISDTTWGISSIDMCHGDIIGATWDMTASDRGQGHFLNSTSDIGDHLSRALDEAGQSWGQCRLSGSHPRQRSGLPETLYHRDDALLYISYVMLIWAAPIPADRWHCNLWP